MGVMMTHTPKNHHGYVLPDIIADDVRLLLCGYSAGKMSARLGHYYANPGNRFWKTLCEVGLTPRLLSPQEDSKLPEYRIGLTDLMKKSVDKDGATPSVADRQRLLDIVLKYQPKMLAFTDGRAAECFMGRKLGWDEVATTEASGTMQIRLVTSTSGGNGHFGRLKYTWENLADAFAEARDD